MLSSGLVKSSVTVLLLRFSSEVGLQTLEVV